MSNPDDFPYKDILDKQRPVSVKHPPMKRSDRAVQFASFAALTGYGELIDEETKRNGEEEPHGEEIDPA